MTGRYRLITMILSLPHARTRAGALLLIVSLAACGGGAELASDPDASGAPDSVSPTSSAPTDIDELPTEEVPGEALPATGDAGVVTATLVNATKAGGSASSLAFALDDDRARQDFAGQFDNDFGQDVLAALDDLDAPADTVPYGTVTAVGCDAPSSVRVDRGEAGFEVTPSMPKEKVQCFAPVTFVVLFAAPTS